MPKKSPSTKKRRKPIPTMRFAKARCDAMGLAWGVTESKIPGTRFSRDLFGFIDMVAMQPGGLLAIQVTSAPNMRSRAKKIMGECLWHATRWLEVTGPIEIWGWDQIPPRDWDLSAAVDAAFRLIRVEMNDGQITATADRGDHLSVFGVGGGRRLPPTE